MINKPCCPPSMPPHYPFNRPARDSYTFCVCGRIPNVSSTKYPVHGPFVGTGFALKDTNPYLIDTTFTKYGQVLCFSESVYTKVTQRRDPSCINLCAQFDMTDTNLTNTVRLDFLEKFISRKYSALSGVLPIIQTPIKFKIHYIITDVDGGVTHEGVSVSTVLDNNFHFTDIRDMHVLSAKGLIIDNIPAMTYQGLYTITIDKVEAFVSVIDTKEHMTDGLNPFYTFTDNNMKIVEYHDMINSVTPDEEIMIASCDVNKSFDYQANITTRLRISFVAFMSSIIACGDTSGVWEAMNEPTSEIITQLRNEVSAMEDEIKSLHEIIEQQNILIQKINGQVELNKNNIIELNTKITNILANDESYDARLDDHERRITKIESIPLATLSYNQGIQFVKAQLTWKIFGEIYQVTRNYTATGNFEKDIADGYLVRLAEGTTDLTTLIEKVNSLETTVTSASETATSAAETVTEFESRLSAVETESSSTSTLANQTATTVTSLTETVNTLDTRMTSAERDVTTNTTSINDLTNRVDTMESNVTAMNTSIETIGSNVETNTSSIETISAKVDEFDSDISDMKIDITAIMQTLGQIKHDVISYVADTSFKRGQITYTTAGTLYQVTTDYVASGDIDQDVEDEYLVPVCKDDIKEPIKVLLTKYDASGEYISEAKYDTLAEAKTALSEDSSTNTYKLTIGKNSGITSIPAYQFQNVSNISEVVIKSNLSTVGNRTFAKCTNLKRATITGNTQSINDMFSECYALESVTLPSTLTNIAPNTFYKCSALTTIELPTTVVAIGNSAFKECTLLETINLPLGLTSIGNSAFEGCSALTPVVFPTGLLSIDYNAFKDCTALTTITIPGTVTNIGANSFNGCTHLSTIVIEEGSLQNISNYAFSDCTSLTSVTIPEGVVQLSDYLFQNDTGLIEITLPESLRSTGIGVFRSCESLTTINFGANIVNLGNETFKDCKSLETITIPTGVQSLAQYLFEGCINLSNVVIPSSVTTITPYVVNGCVSLKTINIPSSVTTIANTAFSGSSIETINIDKTADAINGSPWGADSSTTVNWLD